MRIEFKPFDPYCIKCWRAHSHVVKMQSVSEIC